MDIQAIIQNILGQGELFLRLLLACFCGAIIGIERTHRRKDAGVKTHILLAMGAALFMIVSMYGFSALNLSDSYRADASRVASNIVTGVSFLCAGVIFVRGGSVKGLTTATGVWATAGIGMAAGAGMYAITIFATVLIILIRTLFNMVSSRLEAHGTMDLTISLRSENDAKEKITDITKYAKNKPGNIKISRLENGTFEARMTINVHHSIDELDLVDKLRSDPDIKDISWTN